MTNNQYTIQASDSIGCYGTDNAGSSWATFQVFHHTVSCDDCGAEIKSGWQHGRFGKQLTYHCARHVTVIRKLQP